MINHYCFVGLNHSPQSDIVLGAEIVTMKVKSLVEKLELKNLRETKLKDKEEREAALNAELVAHGKENLASFPNQSYSTTIKSEYWAIFDGKLNRDWIEGIEEIVGSDGKNQMNTQSSANVRTSRMHWTPQCGDKVLYNRQMHGSFVNGHFSSLTKEQRVLPNVLPKKDVAKNKKL